MTAGDTALLLLLNGILLVYAEFNRPGTVLPGAAGALLLMLGVGRMLPLQIRSAWIAACLLAIVLIVLGVRSPRRSWGSAFALAGALGLVFGLRNLVQGSGGVHWIAAIATGTIFSAVTYLLGRIAVLAARNKWLPAKGVLNLHPSWVPGGDRVD